MKGILLKKPIVLRRPFPIEPMELTIKVSPDANNDNTPPTDDNIPPTELIAVFTILPIAPVINEKITLNIPNMPDLESFLSSPTFVGLVLVLNFSLLNLDS